MVESKAMDEGKAEVYKYLRDQHDKIVADRESLSVRYGNVRLLAGLLLTVFSFSTAVIAKSVENAHDFSSRLVALTPVVALAVAFYYVLRSLLLTPGLVGQVEVEIPAPDENEREMYKRGLDADAVDADAVIISLGKNYLRVMGKNLASLQGARITLERCSSLMRKAVIWTGVFLLLTLLSNVVVMWKLV